MRGIIMETKNGRAVLLTKGGEFINIKNKGYSIGDKVNITSSTGRLCAMAASLAIVCAGIGSYFVPAGYVSVDINPSLMMTLNIYNRVIAVESFNDDARMLLNKTGIKGKSAEESVEMLIAASEKIGYINDKNRDVILEVVPGIIKPNMDSIKHKNIDITSEIVDRETLRTAQNMGVSMAKVKAIEEYTEQNGGDMRSNAAKFNDKSVKEIQNILHDNDRLSDKSQPDAPGIKKNENVPVPPKPQENYKAPYSMNNGAVPVHESKRIENKPSYKQPPHNAYRAEENMLIQKEQNTPEIPSEVKSPMHGDITQPKPVLPDEPKPQGSIYVQDNDIPKNKQEQINEPIQEMPTVDNDAIQKEEKLQIPVQNVGNTQNVNSTPSELASEDNKQSDSTKQIPEQKHQDNISDHRGGNPSKGTPKPSEPIYEDNKPSDNRQQITEQKPQESIPNQGSEVLPDKPSQSDVQPANQPQPPDKQPLPADNRLQPSDKPPQQSDDRPRTPDNQALPDEPKSNAPMQNNTPLHINAPRPGEPGRAGDPIQNQPPQFEPKPPNEVGNNAANERMGEHNESIEMP